tara:strand:- start:1624 stop:2025 length:402 start_codon:yes stop_codon:yes gene_type:complete
MNETNKIKGVKMTNSKIKKGDIFVQGVGYSIFRNNFYQVFEISKSGKTVKVAKIDSENVTSEGYGNGTEVPDTNIAWIPEKYWIQARVIEKEVPVWDANNNVSIVKQPALKFPYQESTAKRWDGEPVSYSHMD